MKKLLLCSFCLALLLSFSCKEKGEEVKGQVEKDKKTAITRCSVCAKTLKGHEKTWMTVVTKEKKRMIACCGHCGLFLLHKLKGNFRTAVTPDFKTGRIIDARQAYYVADNDLALCCYPSTISFEKKSDAEKFQKEHGGEIVTLDEAMNNINKIMKGEKK